jgi:hypothetical protein
MTIVRAVRLLENDDAGIARDVFDKRESRLSHVLASFAEKRQHFRKHFFGGDDNCAVQCGAHCFRGRMALVLVVEECHPILRVGEDLLQELGRLGDP